MLFGLGITGTASKRICGFCPIPIARIGNESGFSTTPNSRWATSVINRRRWGIRRGDLADTHAPTEPRELHSIVVGPPKVLLAILAKQKEAVLPFYLECIEALDYPKGSIHLYIRTNNNTDRTAEILGDWVSRVRDSYAGVEMDKSDVEAPVEQFGVHEWNATRFGVLAHIRNVSLAATQRFGCDYYFVVDVDNFLRPHTLRELIALGLPIWRRCCGMSIRIRHIRIITRRSMRTGISRIMRCIFRCCIVT